MVKYKHTNLIAKDWKKLSGFYQEVFDCKQFPGNKRNQSGSWLEKGTGVPNAALEGEHLLLPGFREDGPTLEIFTYKEVPERTSIAANNQGFGHIAFEVDDVKEATEKVLKHGGKNLGEVVEKDVGEVILTFVYLTDPEGNIIELQSTRRKL